ncbi:MAG: heavy metal-associated domain-containing protein [Lachnospiraceae bacterium]|nr:heavy metal-associated domain-containing protein [Lachnospiraceae bacterium]
MYQTTVNVGGMMCSMCESHIKDAIRKAYPAAKKLKANHIKNVASFESEEKPDEGVIKKAIEDTGYDFVGIETSEAAEKKGFHLFG